MRTSYIFVALVALSGLVIWGFLQYGSRGEADEQKEITTSVASAVQVNYENDSTSDKLLVYNLATDFAIASLQEPSTAEFPNTKERLKHVKHLGGKRYRIDSWVDSQDTYGAMRRRDFSCTIKVGGSRVTKEGCIIEEHGYIPNNKL
ncbi:hypothetical protein DXT99_19310 [Pontibacter diazotrophicus]|uniref:Uncharacterized protein n=1 Tax=Pontibacter diazotrophicus TaxID=1400979 RepID=A0A3D8L7W5_9BACT|nr:hypothetical protein [Pontibacter diazotrophicus]RDV13499.1 hypothetical protein DXT99_19310 [Pontibacter diazotrophicus]